ncbi:unnamed protein product [Heligmosomoides polygyrus]|uniref:Flavodoxin-like domain-containing protein n=1 Tax=Heligmosomoides polygyrus TaxID=6339 RepID=A0A183GHZ8_HELPZ|nr:unnamed protein product [Heligmosomoides polygyrus]
MSFHPPIRPDVKRKPPKEWYEELLDRDEILLYFTASLGVLLPGIVYVIYHKVHNFYVNYAKKKELERLTEEAARSEVAVISLCAHDGTAQRFVTHLESVLKSELVNPPKLWPIADLKTKEFAAFKGFCVFVVETLSGGQASSSCEWFLDWLEDVAADAKQKKKANFDALKFAVIGFGSSEDGESQFNRVSSVHLLLFAFIENVCQRDEHLIFRLLIEPLLSLCHSKNCAKISNHLCIILSAPRVSRIVRILSKSF